MRRTTTLLMVLAAAGLAAQTAPAPATPETTAPALITSTEVQAGDSPMVVAAKRAMAARQKAKGTRLTVTPGKGHLFQSTGPVNVSFKMPPAERKPAAPPQARKTDTRVLEQKLRVLLAEQEKIARHADEPMGEVGAEEDLVEKRLTEIQKQVDDLRRQLAEAQGTPPRP